MNTARSNVLLINTPEGVTFPLPLAGPVVRCLALTIDLICVLVIQLAASLAIGSVFLLTPDLAQAVSMLLIFVIGISYAILLEWVLNGQTIGKKLMRIRVIDASGLHLTPSQVIIRNLLRAIDFIPLLYFVGGITCVLSKRCQRLGDIAANTVVVSYPKQVEPDLQGIRPDKYNSFRDYPHLTARLRQNLSPELISITIDALLRRETLTPEARNKAYHELRQEYEQAVTYPAEVTDGLSDERYLRNAIDVLE